MAYGFIKGLKGCSRIYVEVFGFIRLCKHLIGLYRLDEVSLGVPLFKGLCQGFPEKWGLLKVRAGSFQGLQGLSSSVLGSKPMGSILVPFWDYLIGSSI